MRKHKQFLGLDNCLGSMINLKVSLIRNQQLVLMALD